MTRKELVNALRGCVGGGNPCKACALYGKMGCIKILNDAAADEIERLQNDLDRNGWSYNRLSDEDKERLAGNAKGIQIGSHYFAKVY